MKRLQLRLAKWLLKRLDYKFVAIKQTPITNRYGEKVIKHNVYTEIPTLFIEGDKELLRYTDVMGYISGKDPLKRGYSYSPEFPWPTPISKLPPEVLAEIEATTIPFPEEIKKQNETID
jgi:hypothetical protein